MCIGLASGFNNSDIGRVPDSCKFENGIKECKEAVCYHNILGGCFRKGSGFNPNGEHKDFTAFERVKSMNIDEFAKFLTMFEFNAIVKFCAASGKPFTNDELNALKDIHYKERVSMFKKTLEKEFSQLGEFEESDSES